MIESIPMMWWFWLAAAGFSFSSLVALYHCFKTKGPWYVWLYQGTYTVGLGSMIFFVWLLQAYDDKITEFVSTQDQQILQILMNMAQAMVSKGMI